MFRLARQRPLQDNQAALRRDLELIHVNLTVFPDNLRETLRKLIVSDNAITNASANACNSLPRLNRPFEQRL